MGILIISFSLLPATNPNPDISNSNPLTWTQVNFDGFGQANNNAIWSLAVFNNKLYAGTRNPNGAQVWRSATGAGDWTKANQDGFGDIHNTAIPAMEGMNYLYTLTENAVSGPEVFTMNTSDSWTQINPDAFGDSNNLTAWSLSCTMLSGPIKLWVGTNNWTTGTEIWEKRDSGWSQINTDGFGDKNNVIATSMVDLDSDLFVGTWNTVSGAEIWHDEPYNPGWTQINTDGFGDKYNLMARSMAIYGHHLYVGTFNEITGAEVWRYNLDSGGWTQVNTDGFGDAKNLGANSMLSFAGWLFIGTENHNTGAEIWRTQDGTQWEQVNHDGFGDSKNNEVMSLMGFGAYLYAGTANFTTGGEVWRTNLLGTNKSFQISNNTTNVGEPMVVYNSQSKEYLVSWHNREALNLVIRAQRLAWYGKKVGDPFLVRQTTDIDYRYPMIAYDSDQNRYLAVYLSESTTEKAFNARTISATGSQLGEERILITKATNWLLYPYGIGYDPETQRYLIIYLYNPPSGTSGIAAQLLQNDGSSIGSPLDIAQFPNYYGRGAALAYNPVRKEFFVVWADASSANVFGRIVTPTNPPTLGGIINLSPGTDQIWDEFPSVGVINTPPGKGSYLVAWEHKPFWNYYPWDGDVWGIIVNGDGSLYDSPHELSALYGNPWDLDVAGNDQSKNFLVTWSNFYGYEHDAIYVMGRRISNNGATIGDEFWIGGSFAYEPDAASGFGGSQLVVYRDWPPGDSGLNVFGTLLGNWSYLPLVVK